jgi:hypothetical protein
MRIAIVSDTHGNVANFKKVVSWLNKENIQIILHCGDIGDPESLKESLADFQGEFFGVFGNMDKGFKILIDEYNKIPKVEVKEDIFEIKIEDPPSPQGASARRRKIVFTHFPDGAKKLAQSGKFDLVFYGHTHRPWDEKIGDCHMINPGELAGQFYKPTFAIYDTATGELQLKILEKL